MPGDRISITNRPGSTTRSRTRGALADQTAAARRTPPRGRAGGARAPRRPGPCPRRTPPTASAAAQHPGQVSRPGWPTPPEGAARSPGAVSSSSARCRTGRRRGAPCRCHRSRCPTSSRPPRSSAWRAGRPVITAIAATSAASSTSTSAASGWMWAARGSSTIGRQGAVEVQPDHGVRRGADQRGVPLLAGNRGELHGLHPTTRGRWGRRQAASPVRITVTRSSRIGSTAGRPGGCRGPGPAAWRLP